MADYGVNVWDRVGQLGYSSAQRTGLLMWYGTVPAVGSVSIPDVDDRPGMWGVWDTANGGPDGQARSYLTYSYDAGTRVATITNTSGAAENNVFVMKW